MDENDSHPDENDDQHSHHNCHDNFIRPSSSSSIRAPSWSLGFGADLRAAIQDSEPNGDIGCDEQLRDSSGSSSGSFHVYQVNIRTSAQVEWSVYRRYSQFLTLHQQLKASEPAIGKFSFPPKRRLNSKASTIVQERRRKLEEYMRNLCELIVKCPLKSVDNGSYEKLTNLARTGPTKPSRVSSQSGAGGSLYEFGGDVDGSLTSSARSEQTIADQDIETADVNNIEPSIDVGINEASARVGDQARSELQPERPSSLVVIEETGHLEVPTAESVSFKQTNKSRAKSVRYLFYDFISPDGTNEAEFELDHLGV